MRGNPIFALTVMKRMRQMRQSANADKKISLEPHGSNEALFFFVKIAGLCHIEVLTKEYNTLSAGDPMDI